MVDGCFSHIHWSQAVPMVKVEETENLLDWCMLALLTILRVEYHEVPLDAVWDKYLSDSLDGTKQDSKSKQFPL